MKTQISIKKLLKIGFFVACFISLNKSFSQGISQPYPVMNNTSCSVTVSYTLYSATCGTTVATITIPPNSTSNITVPASGDDIDMEVLWIDNANCTIVSQSPNPVGANQGCSSANTSGSLTWNAMNPNCTCTGFPTTITMTQSGATIT